MNAIEIKDLSKSFRGMYAVDHLNMTVPMGAIYGLIGENGSGKSTTEKMICEMTADELDAICRTYVALQSADMSKTKMLLGCKYSRVEEDEAISKTLAGFVCGALMLIAYFIGAVIGGAVSGLSFDLYGLTAANLLMCLLSKILLMPVFVSIFTLISVAAKQKAWLSICGSLGGGMLLFMMLSMITPLSSTVTNVVLCLVGGIVFAVGPGAIGNAVLKKTSLV